MGQGTRQFSTGNRSTQEKSASVTQPQPNRDRPPTQEEIDNEAFHQHKFAAWGLQLKQQSSSITPAEQTKLTSLQTQMDDFWAQRASRFAHNFAHVPVQSPQPPIAFTKSIPSFQNTQPIQAKLSIGQSNDRYEQEADRIATEVVDRLNTPSPQSETIQRQEITEKDDDKLQMKPVSQNPSGSIPATPELEAAIGRSRSGGHPLAANIRHSMEPAFGADFSGVRVHTNAQADQLNRSIQAKAFTTGQNIFFRQGAYQPGNRAGQELIAHEMTHVVQQRQGCQPYSTIQRALATIDEVNPVNLAAHATAVNNVNTAVGRGAKTTSGLDLQTKITWKNPHSTGEGTGVEANPLGPDHPLGSPTAGNKGINIRVKGFNDAFAGTWKQGHLLNAKLGGPGGDPRNLVAISQSTNSKMSDNFENEIQRRINEKGEWMHFKVDVTHEALTSDESIKALKGHLVKSQFFWAETLNVEWGSLDKDGNKTGNTKKTSLVASQPVARGIKVKATTGKVEETASGAITPGAVTTIGEEDVILDSDDSVVAQVKDKEQARKDRRKEACDKRIEELLMELEAPPTPYRTNEFVDDVMDKYDGYQPLTKFSGAGRINKWQGANKRERERRNDAEPYNQDLLSAVRKAKVEPERAIPQRLGTLLKDNLTSSKLDNALATARSTWADLGDRVTSMKGVLLFGTPLDFAMLMKEYYETNPKLFSSYTKALEDSLSK